MTNYQTITTLAIISIAIISCHVPTLNDQIGTMHLSIDAMNVKTLEPNISLDPANYHIAGFGPSGESFDIDTAEASVDVPDLLIGEWNILVSAENSSGHLIGQGSSPVLIRTGTVEPVSIFVSPVDGTGTFDLAVTWNPAAVDIAGIEGELLDTEGVSRPLTFDVLTGSARHIGGILDSGYYTLVVQLKDNGIPVMGAVEVTRIVSGAITAGSYDFTDINQPGGSVQINITPNMEDPVEVAISGQVPELTLNSSMTITASTPSESTAVIYAWYLNGVSITLGNSITLGQTLEPGYYRVDVTAFTTDGRRAGSTTHQFTVLEG
ncbi:MAG: hypothetical protein HN368_12130 [Spirochaetales bacterium]|jgi:hypothetical protein|nr:hypothetical protein [Spirochaetales bacterium]